MKHRSSYLIAASLVGALTVALIPSFAAPRLMSGNVTQNNVAQLTHQINWHASLPQAEYQAQREGKMIFWMHMLGNLSGAT
ncbi:MAG: hypothetical protein EKK48_00880 [Candidatus Melainabacteria bacterium]|nr:MAG: hypothetical protein EKK48_00880 [Candidatus Melainabacteria bacterium]